MKLKLNGDTAEFQDGLTVAGLLENLKIEPGRVAVEVNMEIVKKQDYQKVVVKQGDSIEIVNFVGGG
ncbi:MAG TPA: sulfur carrier protein ThiS [Nitrospirae bacterium]|nr:sulfur carrier protein ThiS [bacterium BMS3Abin10]GBE38420.1 sulfur carrier protein ThiS [bacterium BMS3Bbin08]HDO25652.1 sulfur carrier protein ThiS [Nitrospirota bacterium]